MTKYIFCAVVLAAGLFSVSSNAQDLMARQADADMRLRAVDSVSLVRSFQRSQSENVSDLYHTWKTERLFGYEGERLPMFYKIDLRDFTMPIKSTQVTSNFGYRRRFRRKHYGLDVKLYTGDTVVAAFSGKVRVVDYDRGGYGYYVVIRHPNGLETLYGHLSKQLVEEDQIVASGEPIGLGGNTGRSTGAHLHFETRLLGDAIDPSLLFDFEAQDVTGDYYVYRNSKGYDLADIIEGEDATVYASVDAGDEADAATEEQYYKVKSGDTLWSIAKAHGVALDDLLKLNGLSRRSRIIKDQVLKLR